MIRMGQRRRREGRGSEEDERRYEIRHLPSHHPQRRSLIEREVRQRRLHFLRVIVLSGSVAVLPCYRHGKTMLWGTWRDVQTLIEKGHEASIALQGKRTVDRRWRMEGFEIETGCSARAVGNVQERID